jgi:hypothetical protein
VPAADGFTAAARLRGTAVKLASAVRSAGATTTVTYEVRVGTSICRSAVRIRSCPSVPSEICLSTGAIRQRLDGLYVKTAVLIDPIRSTSQAANGRDPADSA